MKNSKKIKAEPTSSEIQDAIDELWEAQNQLGEVMDILRSVASDFGKSNYFNYNISGNMEAYLINYLDGFLQEGGNGSIPDYISQAEAVLEELEYIEEFGPMGEDDD